MCGLVLPQLQCQVNSIFVCFVQLLVFMLTVVLNAAETLHFFLLVYVYISFISLSVDSSTHRPYSYICRRSCCLLSSACGYRLIQRSRCIRARNVTCYLKARLHRYSRAVVLLQQKKNDWKKINY